MQAIRIRSRKNDGSEQRSAIPPAPYSKVMQQQDAGRRLQQNQAQINQVVDIMRANLDKMLDEDEKLAELDQRADHLYAGASQFKVSEDVKKRMDRIRSHSRQLTLFLLAILSMVAAMCICMALYVNAEK